MRLTVTTIHCDHCKQEMTPLDIVAAVTIGPPTPYLFFEGASATFDLCGPCVTELGDFMGLNPTKVPE